MRTRDGIALSKEGQGHSTPHRPDPLSQTQALPTPSPLSSLPTLPTTQTETSCSLNPPFPPQPRRPCLAHSFGLSICCLSLQLSQWPPQLLSPFLPTLKQSTFRAGGISVSKVCLSHTEAVSSTPQNQVKGRCGSTPSEATSAALELSCGCMHICAHTFIYAHTIT